MSRSAEGTLHRQILSEIEGRIVSGAWPPGHRIPGEIDLARQYGCSRMTVNKVLTQLVSAGLIERRRRSGTFVRQPVSQSAILEIHDIRREIEALNLSYAMRLVRRSVRPVRKPDLARLALPPGASVLDLTCVHLGGGRPFCLERRLISLAAVPHAETAEFSAVTPGQWLLDEVPWTSAEHRIEAVSADAASARLLEVAAGTACLVVARRTWSGGTPVTHVRFTYPGDRHLLVARFSPSA
jgi:GntR family histidine utilization transcriptional repressor